MLANILLDELDRELERRGHRFVRYADDLLILVKTPRAGHRVMDSVTRFLTRKFKLVVNEHKSRVAKTNAREFLSFTFRGTKLRWSERAFEDFQHTARRLTGRSWGVSMSYQLHKLAQCLRGWMGSRHLGLLSPDPGTGRVAAPTGEDVLLETVAQDANESAPPASAGYGQTPSDPHGAEFQELLAPLEDTSEPDRNDE